MIQNYMACSIQNYGSDAFRFTLRRSVIHPWYTRPARRKKLLPTESPYGAALRVQADPLPRPPPCANKPLLTGSDHTVFKENQHGQAFVCYLFTDERL